jgi:hypothetical protein
VNIPSSQSLNFTLIAVLIGAISGLLTAEASRFLHPANPLIGIIFGISIIVLLRLKHVRDSGRVSAALLIFSVVSYLAAVWVTLPLYSALGRFLGADFADPLDTPVFIFAGFLGALIINAALLERLSGLTGPQAIAKAAPWAGGGAFFGFIAAELSGPVGAAVAKIVGDPPGTQMGDNEPVFFAAYSAYVIWQTGMAFLITFMLSRDESVPAGTQQIAAGRS